MESFYIEKRKNKYIREYIMNDNLKNGDCVRFKDYDGKILRIIDAIDLYGNLVDGELDALVDFGTEDDYEVINTKYLVKTPKEDK